MCGLAGILSTREGAIDEARLLRIRDTMLTRGPDDAGTWHRADGRVGLAHRRLSIVDLSAAGYQPMASDDGRLQLVYNGEIYNHTALRAELEQLGYRFRGRCDTEVLLNGYRAWGERVLDRLIGMFAFAIWDDAQGELFVARDRVGIKPFYFCRTGDELLFASEIKAILADPAVPREVEPAAVWHYLTFLVPPAPLTMFRGIYKLPAGHAMRVKPGGEPRLWRWWDPVDAPPAGLDPAVYRDEASAARELETRLVRSIERRMMADVPFGVFLSGGLDSSLNVALMARCTSLPVETFTVGFKDHRQYNELEYARAVAERFGTNHHEVLIDDVDMSAYLPQLVHQQDEPIADWVCVPLYFVSKLARDSGVIVVQVGEGSDELFCGYDHFKETLKQYRHYGRPLARMPRPVRGAAVALARGLGTFDAGWKNRAAFAAEVARGGEIFWGGATCWRGAEKDALWSGSRTFGPWPSFVPPAFAKDDSEAVVRHFVGGFRAENPHADFYQSMLYLELRQRLPELLLMRVDKITMSTSVEARVPFLDHELVEFAMDLPLALRLANGTGKYLLRKIARGLLPDSVIDRPKVGFGAPVREWLRGPFGRFARERLLESGRGLFEPRVVQRLFEDHDAGRADYSLHLWVLLNFALWHDHWIEGRGL